MFRLASFPAVVAVAVIATGCAKSPESIAPSYISDISYRPLPCQDLANEERRTHEALSRASEQQEQARTADAVGVIMIGIPVSTLSGDNVAPEVARLKGEIEAIHRAMATKKCG
jgi:hypothetical protein